MNNINFPSGIGLGFKSDEQGWKHALSMWARKKFNIGRDLHVPNSALKAVYRWPGELHAGNSVCQLAGLPGALPLPKTPQYFKAPETIWQPGRAPQGPSPVGPNQARV